MSLYGKPLQSQHKKMDHEVADLPSGPLDTYRKKASFNWKDMLYFIDGEKALAFKVTADCLCSSENTFYIFLIIDIHKYWQMTGCIMSTAFTHGDNSIPPPPPPHPHPHPHSGKRFGATLGALSGGRVSITRMALVNLKLALIVSIRFSATRRQFGPKDTEEIPVLEYQLQQWRLIPYLSAAYALEHFSKSIFMNFVEFQIGQAMRDKSDRQAELGREIHAIGCSSKPLGSWIAQRGIQECREACGGHGYLAMNRLGDLRNDNDPNCTYEGDNNVLLQQTSNYLLSLFHAKHYGGVQIESPLHSVDFLNDFHKILGSKFIATAMEECMDSAVSVGAYKWLVCFLLVESHRRLEQQRAIGMDDFDARNNSQVYYCRSLAIAYIEHYCLQRFHELSTDPETPAGLRPVLSKLCALYGLWSLSSHMATLYQGNYFSGKKPAELVQMGILTLCSQLKDDAVSLVDVFAPSDFILNSPIGRADGQLYKNLWSTVMQGSKVLERPSWWKEFCSNKAVVGSLRPKL
uniref:Peroxisomal acyl-coenzyme A oxidase 3 n=1 Tax=Mastacembelus armatus TaxID=205130 RepID=A0A7N8Y9K9_9TELE